MRWKPIDTDGSKAMTRGKGEGEAEEGKWGMNGDGRDLIGVVSTQMQFTDGVL